MDIKVGDWVILDMKVGQIKEIKENGCAVFSDGYIEHRGRILDRCRPLTLRSKAIADSMDYYYRSLRKIDGNSGFNYPRIVDLFSDMTCMAIDHPQSEKDYFDIVKDFIQKARNYTPVIHGINLFRRAA